MENDHNNAENIVAFDPPKETVVKWLQLLFVCQIVSLVMTALGMVASIGSIIGWLSRAVSVAVIVALFKLAVANERYRKAAIFHSISVGGNIISALTGTNILGIVFSVCSIIASYQQLTAHAEITAPKNTKLAGKWTSLFYCQLVVGLLSGFVSSAGVVIAVLADIDPDSIVSAALIFISLINVTLGLFHVLYLKQTLALYME